MLAGGEFKLMLCVTDLQCYLFLALYVAIEESLLIQY